MWAIVGRIICCPLLNSKSPLICIVGKHQKHHKPRSLNYCFFANQLCYSLRCPSCITKALRWRVIWRLPSANVCEPAHVAKCECLRSKANCQVQMFVKQPNRQVQQLLVVENKKNLQQLKPSTLYMVFQLTLIFYSHHTGMRSEMLYTNGSFEIWQVRMFVKQRRTHGWSSYLPGKNIFVLKQKSPHLYIIMF